MTRIIAGFAGSLTLAVPRSGTRPTSDRVREAVFSSLDARGALAGASVLDLYAGSGALGLEAASRGARRVTLVERGKSAAAVCRKNAALVRASAPQASTVRIEVAAVSVRDFLAAPGEPVDVAFLDPPYDLADTELTHNLAALAPRLNRDATVLLERSSRSAEPAWPGGLVLERRKNYGDTALWWLRRAAADDPAAEAARP